MPLLPFIMKWRHSIFFPSLQFQLVKMKLRDKYIFALWTIHLHIFDLMHWAMIFFKWSTDHLHLDSNSTHLIKFSTIFFSQTRLNNLTVNPKSKKTQQQSKIPNYGRDISQKKFEKIRDSFNVPIIDFAAAARSELHLLIFSHVFFFN